MNFKKWFKIILLFFPDTSNRSAVYTRWGRKDCPSSAELVLSGTLSDLKIKK